MRAILISDDGEEAGLVQIKMNDITLAAMNCLSYGERDQPYPAIGDSFVPEFTYLHDEHVSLESLLSSNPNEKMTLIKTGMWSYLVFGKVVSGSSEHEYFVDCSCCLLPLPEDMSTSTILGQYVGFEVSRLSVWRAKQA